MGRFKKCFRCAVDFVINRFGVDPNCDCRTMPGPLCIRCECGGLEQDCPPLPAFQAAEPPYSELASLYAGYAGSYTVQKAEGIFMFCSNTEKAALRLLASARTDPLAYDAAVYLLADCVRFNFDVPKPLREWGFFALTGQIKRPKQGGKYPPALIWRDQAIVSMINDVVQYFGLKATSAAVDGGESACKAVAEGLRLMRLQPDSYPTIKRIWQSRKKQKIVPIFIRPEQSL
ncbi:hypothetical protein SAMN04488092_10777 [Thalassovita taeanensis]|uniref:Uncharacterized protein n=2 Tax=Thalassovita taeanensis TaxID=657014 RepID=A0A1H9G859_9RHOB|nr:hypothetical protein SAMN04488092_10777 [Thalassovita taeanensis]